MFILLKILESQAYQFFSIIREIFSYSYLMPDLFMDFVENTTIYLLVKNLEQTLDTARKKIKKLVFLSGPPGTNNTIVL